MLGPLMDLYTRRRVTGSSRSHDGRFGRLRSGAAVLAAEHEPSPEPAHGRQPA
jgi:hypothetical protein